MAGPLQGAVPTASVCQALFGAVLKLPVTQVCFRLLEPEVWKSSSARRSPRLVPLRLSLHPTLGCHTASLIAALT